MARVTRRTGRNGLPEVELLESRSLLSSLHFDFSIDGTVAARSADSDFTHISTQASLPDPARSQPPLAVQLVTNPSQPRVTECGSVQPDPGDSDGAEYVEAGDELMIELRGQGQQWTTGIGTAYVEDDWLVIEMPIPYTANEPSVAVYVSPGGSVITPSSDQSPPANTQLQPSKRSHDFEVVLRIPPNAEISGAGVIQSQTATDRLPSSKLLERQGTGRGEPSIPELHDTALAAGAVRNTLKFGDPSMRPDSKSDPVGLSTAVGEDQLQTTSERMATGNSEQRVSPTHGTQPSDVNSTPQTPEVVVADQVKGIKIRGAYVNTADPSESRRVVDLAVVRFEKPIAIRVQLPFLLEVQHEVSAPARAMDAAADSSAIVDSVDAVLMEAENEASKLNWTNWKISGGLVMVAAALGYFVGSRRGPSLESQIGTPSTELYIPAFSEAQLSRLTYRLGGTKRERLHNNNQSGRSESNGPRRSPSPSSSIPLARITSE